MSVGLLLSALALTPSCGGPDESLVSPCESALTCGDTCSAATPCGSGLHCSGSKCTAECIPGDKRCGPGKGCNSSGKCVAGISLGVGGTQTGGGSSGVGGDTGVCAGTNLNL
ncbi:MAG TPA: hypothetical protein VEX18_14385, partial [Polyangiaceae bacterium]|nr:hypothetical protein [Polyangiaceae bacterium]